MQNMERAMVLLQSVEIVINNLLNESSPDIATVQAPALNSVKALIIEAHNELLDS